MVNIAKTHKEVLQQIQNSKMAESFLQDDVWQKFDLYAQEYNDKATVKRIPHLVSSTEMVIKKIQDDLELDEDDIAVLHLMNKCKSKVDAKKSKAKTYYANKKDGKSAVVKRVREELIQKDPSELTDEDKKHNEKLLKKQELNKKRKRTDSETRARDKFFKMVIQSYLPNVSEIVEKIDAEVETEVDAED